MNVVQWAEENWRLENGARLRLRPWQSAVLLAMFPPDGSASRFETFLVSTVKKVGKTTLNAIATLYAILTFPAPETAYVVANDEAQAQERVFDIIVKAIRAMGLEARGEAAVTRSEVWFPETGSRIVALPADFAGAAGAIFGVSSWTELWAFRHEGHVRLWEELTPIPNRRSLRLVDSYAGFTGDAPVLEPIWQRALAGERLEGELPIFVSGGLWAFIDTGEEAQLRGWLDDLLRPGTFARLHLNAWQSGEEAFVTAEDWDACVVDGLRPLLPGEKGLTLSVGVDAATKTDCSAIAAVAREGERVRLVAHRIWTPRPSDPIDLEDTVEAYLLWLHENFRLGVVRFDPYQLQRSMATLRRAGIPVEEYPQTSGNLTLAGQALYDLVRGRNLAMYPDPELRQHALNAVAIETARGWRLAKEKSSRKVDGVVALSFACVAALADSGDRGGGGLCSRCGWRTSDAVPHLCGTGQRRVDRYRDRDSGLLPPGAAALFANRTRREP